MGQETRSTLAPRQARRSVPNQPVNRRPATSDYDAQIARVEAEIEALKPRVREALDAWLDATAPWVGERWQETLEAGIAYNPGAVKALGDEKRKALKEQTTAMIETPREHIEQRLVGDHPEAWPHLREGATASDPYENFITKSDRVGGKTVQTVPNGVSSMLEGVLSDMADLLEAEGFSIVSFIPGSSRSRAQRARVAPGQSLEWSDAMMSTMTVYGQLVDAYAATLKERETVEAQKARSEAEELWGKA
jgi:hypothetical protein